MATRFYLPSSGAAAVNPSYDAGWEVTTNTDRIRMVAKNSSNPTITAITAKSENTPSTSTQDSLSRQFVSDMIGKAIAFEGTFSMVISTDEDIFAKATLAVLVKVVSGDGGTSRGTLYSVFGTGTEFSASAETRIVTAATITPLISQAGDRIVVEIGYNWSAPTAGQDTTLRFGNDASSDFALTAGLNTALNPWVEFSQNIPVTLPNTRLRPAIFAPGIAR